MVYPPANAFTHPGTNRVLGSATTLIEDNALPTKPNRQTICLSPLKFVKSFDTWQHLAWEGAFCIDSDTPVISTGHLCSNYRGPTRRRTCFTGARLLSEIRPGSSSTNSNGRWWIHVVDMTISMQKMTGSDIANWWDQHNVYFTNGDLNGRPNCCKPRKRFDRIT